MTNHYHCPNGCEHPQPIEVRVSECDPMIVKYGPKYYICGRCFHVYNKEVVCLPCSPEICDD